MTTLSSILAEQTCCFLSTGEAQSLSLSSLMQGYYLFGTQLRYLHGNIQEWVACFFTRFTPLIALNFHKCLKVSPQKETTGVKVKNEHLFQSIQLYSYTAVSPFLFTASSPPVFFSFSTSVASLSVSSSRLTPQSEVPETSSCDFYFSSIAQFACVNSTLPNLVSGVKSQGKGKSWMTSSSISLNDSNYF